jgi:hypothetical protein
MRGCVMKLYLVTPTIEPDWDCAEAFVVRASNTAQAKRVTMGRWGDMSPTMDELVVELLGESGKNQPSTPGVVFRSFKAG